ncbi:heat shock 70 kDa protein 12A-like [Mercenaria mercenaria]|uniref:heat shock 70 kDa protein 12A-like n=1 Tax=Mercenaria mercenaria TaxID=6596 RepID=UPI00234F71F4|nr:heat shock 70 kDa protein 12A-like [Mercenaria mercenaria]
MTQVSSSSCKLVVAAMDFGTTYSGYAFSFRDDPDRIETNEKWVAGSAQLMSMKCPTTVLLTPDKKFHSFGFEAENKFADLAEDDCHHDWYLFRRFKMTLYDSAKNLQIDTPLEDIMGKAMPAIDIFSHSIRFLKNHLLSTLNIRTIGIRENEIQYVITVPAIWNERAKQFMRRAANKADIPNKQITFALEPEAASIWCQVVTKEKLTGLSEPSAKYMVVDLGGGTADITVHQKMDDGSLKELHKASGGAWGGNEVDKAYVQLLTELVGKDAMEKFKLEAMTDYFDLLRDFETKKRTITTDTDGKIAFRIPAALRELAESEGVSVKEKIAESRFKGIVTWTGDKLRIEKTTTIQLFDIPLKMLINHIKELFTEPKVQDVGTVLLVGGFGECGLVKAAFEESFPDKRLMIPPEAGLAVLKGAVRFGHLPEIVSTRISRFTIGREGWPIFEAHHDPDKKVEVGGTERCKDVFQKMVEIDQEITKMHSYEEQTTPVSADSEGVMIKLFSSTKRDVKYTTELDCQELGSLCFKVPDSSEIEDKKVAISYIFGETEIHVHVRSLKTNDEHEVWIECFSEE